MIKIRSFFNHQKRDYEDWFENHYLSSLGLRNRRISNDDFEGIICDNEDREIAFFELKLVSLPNIQKEVDEEFENFKNSEYFQPKPKYEEVKRRLRDIIAEAANQVLNKEKSKSIARIVFIIRNTNEFYKEDLIDAIKSNRMVIIYNKQLFLTYGSQNENKEALDLFYDKNLSGLICLTIEYKNSCYSYSSIIIKNKDASIPIPDVFIRNVESIDEI
jgi:hypothetical protein